MTQNDRDQGLKTLPGVSSGTLALEGRRVAPSLSSKVEILGSNFSTTHRLTFHAVFFCFLLRLSRSRSFVPAYAALTVSLCACCALSAVSSPKQPELSDTLSNNSATSIAIADFFSRIEFVAIASHLIATFFLRYSYASLLHLTRAPSSVPVSQQSNLRATLLEGFAVFASAAFCISTSLAADPLHRHYGELLAVVSLHIFGNWYYSFARVKYPHRFKRRGNTNGTEPDVESIMNASLLFAYTLADLFSALRVYLPGFLDHPAARILKVSYALRTVGDLARLFTGAHRIASEDDDARQRARS